MNSSIQKTKNEQDFPTFMYGMIDIQLKVPNLFSMDSGRTPRIYYGALKSTRWSIRTLRAEKAQGREFAAAYLVKKAAELSDIATRIHVEPIVHPTDAQKTIFAIQQFIGSELVKAGITLPVRPSDAHVKAYHYHQENPPRIRASHKPMPH